MFNELRSLLGRAGQVEAGAVKAVSQSPLVQLINSVNPFHAQEALSPESLRPTQHAGGWSEPYNINGQQPQVGWAPHFPVTLPSKPMPELLGQPDWTAVPPPTANSSAGIDQPNVVPSWSPQVNQISPGIQHPVWSSEQDGQPVRYPRFQT